MYALGNLEGVQGLVPFTFRVVKYEGKLDNLEKKTSWKGKKNMNKSQNAFLEENEQINAAIKFYLLFPYMISSSTVLSTKSIIWYLCLMWVIAFESLTEEAGKVKEHSPGSTLQGQL